MLFLCIKYILIFINLIYTRNNLNYFVKLLNIIKINKNNEK